MVVAPGLAASWEIIVGEDDTAIAMGSGEVPVLATPRLLALAEAATIAALEGHLREDETSVGTRVALEHLDAVGVGVRVVAHAELAQVDGQLLRFAVRVEAGDQGVLVGQGEVARAVVSRERFMSRIG